MQNDEQGHVCDDFCQHETVPRGEAAHGWVWIVGIIVVVAVILFLLQSNVPDVVAPVEVTEPSTVVDEPRSGGDVIPSDQSEAEGVEGTPSDSSATDEPAASDSVRVELEGATE